MLQRGPHPLPAFLNLLQQQSAGDTGRFREMLAGLRAYQQHPARRALAEPPVVARCGAACLRDFGGSGPAVVVVPSLINSWHVLDIDDRGSLLRWLAAQGFRVLLVDWGTPGDAESRLDLGGHVRERLLPLIAAAGGEVSLVGYCLGGTLAIAAAGACPQVRRLALIATPWDFSAYPDAPRAALKTMWQTIERAVGTAGLLPLESLQPAFWSLDAAATAEKFIRFATMPADSAEARGFVLVEDWANGGPPVAAAAAGEIFTSLIDANAAARGQWIARLEDVSCPMLGLVSARDRLVPLAASAPVADRLQIDAGHVGMILGRQARALLWEPLADFLRR